MMVSVCLVHSLFNKYPMLSVRSKCIDLITTNCCLDHSYQLVTWSKDQSLRLWTIEPMVLKVQDRSVTVCFQFYFVKFC